jgi:hypothetical protein
MSATTYNFTDGALVYDTVPKVIESPYVKVLRNICDFSAQAIDAGEADVAQCIAIPAGTIVLDAFVRVKTAETADGTMDLGYGGDADYWGKNLNLDTTAGSVIPTILLGSATWDAGSIDDGNEEAKDVTIAGAAIGDYVTVSMGVDVADLAVAGQVTAEDTVTVSLLNNTGGAIDLASTTVSVVVNKAPLRGNPVYFATADTIDLTASVINGDVNIDGAIVEVIALTLEVRN